MAKNSSFPSASLPNAFPTSQADPFPPMAYGVAVDVPSTVVSFEVPLPRGAGPGTRFTFQVAPGQQHEMIVPDGVRAGMVLRCMLVPPNAPPGCDVLVQSSLDSLFNRT